MSETFVIIGAGQAGAWVAKTLRSEGFSGRIVLIGKEAHYPYERPPLSKSALVQGTFQPGETILDTASAEAADIDVRLDTLVVEIDRTRQLIACNDGSSIAYGRLFITTGSVPRKPNWLRDGASNRICFLRTRDDAMRLHQKLGRAQRLLILGGGWIGLEAAASARKIGLDVSVYEAAERLCARSLPAALSEWLRSLHEGNGVKITTGAIIKEVHEDQDGVRMLLSDGQTVTGDLMLVGIGNLPAVDLAKSAGLEVDNGIVVDHAGRTSDSRIFAAGDVTNQPCSITSGRARRESWANAQNQAIVAARAALGQDVAHNEIPWIWSDQYDANIQILGIPEQAANLAPHPATKPDTFCWLATNEEGRPIGAIAVNAPRELRAARKIMAAGDVDATAAWS